MVLEEATSTKDLIAGILENLKHVLGKNSTID